MNAPIINPIWFYLMDVSGKVGFATGSICFVTAVFFVFFGVGWLCSEETNEKVKKEELNILKKFATISVITGLIFFIIPSQPTMMKMLIAQNVTYERVEGGKEMMKETVDYLFEKIDENQREEE